MEKSKITSPSFAKASEDQQNSKLINIINKIIRYLYYSLFFITPLIMASFTSELFEFNKIIFIYLTTLLVIFFWFLKMILYKKIIIKKTSFDIPILVFFASQILSTLFSIDRHTSLYGYYGRFNGGLLSILSYFILYYGFISNLEFKDGFKSVNKFLKISLVSSVMVILWGIPGKFGRDLSCLLFLGQFNNSCWTDQFRPAERMFSTLGQPNWLGAYLAINFFIALFFFLRKKDFGKDTIIYLVFLTLNFSSILFTRSRSAFGALVIGLVVFSSLAFTTYKEYFKIQVKKFIILILCLVLLVLLIKTGIEKIDKIISISSYSKAIIPTASVKKRLVQQSENKQKPADLADSSVTTSSDIRKIVWKGAIDLGLRYPLFGSGVETFAYSYYFVRPKEHNLTSEWDYLYNKAHNEYLNYLATTGFVGLSSYFFMLIVILFYGWNMIKVQNSKYKITVKNSKIINNETLNKNKFDSGQAIDQWNNQLLIICLLLSYITILITNFFGFSTTTINLFFYLIPAFIIVITSNQHTVKNNPSTLLKTNWFQKILIIVLLSSFLYFFSSLSKYYFADIKYASADNFSKLGEYQKAAQLLNDAYSLRYEHVYEDKLSYVLANIAFIASYQKENDTANKMRQTANELNLKSLMATPKNVLYWKTKTKNYYLFYQISLKPEDLTQGIQALQEAKKISPTDPKIPYSLAVFYSLLEDESKDEEKKLKYQQLSQFEVDQSIKLKSNFRDGYFLKGTLLKKLGRKEEAGKAFNYILEYLNPNDEDVKKELESL